MKKYIYKGLALTNDIKALKRGRIVPRIWNRLLLKITRMFMK
ncbi:MAG: hypothetical protein RBR71_13890 [Gudongella sp.]|nr:hypothetical protein [Gudongella sp.]